MIQFGILGPLEVLAGGERVALAGLAVAAAVVATERVRCSPPRLGTGMTHRRMMGR